MRWLIEIQTQRGPSVNSGDKSGWSWEDHVQVSQMVLIAFGGMPNMVLVIETTIRTFRFFSQVLVDESYSVFEILFLNYENNTLPMLDK